MPIYYLWCPRFLKDVWLKITTEGGRGMKSVWGAAVQQTKVIVHKIASSSHSHCRKPPRFDFCHRLQFQDDIVSTTCFVLFHLQQNDKCVWTHIRSIHPVFCSTAELVLDTDLRESLPKTWVNHKCLYSSHLPIPRNCLYNMRPKTLYHVKIEIDNLS